MKITYDKEADAIYIYFMPEKRRRMHPYKETIGDYPVNIDISKDDRILGIEVLHAKKC